MQQVMMMGRKIGGLVNGTLKPTLLMVVAQVVIAGVNIFYKLAANDGMSLRIVVAYRFLFASAFLVPLALYVERKSRPKLTWMILFQSFLTGLFGGSLAQNLYIESLVLTSVTFATAMCNLIPAITFVMAISIGMERLGLDTMPGIAKVVGTLTGIGGAMVLTFYKGIEINPWSTHVELLHHDGHVATSELQSSNHHLLGAFLALASCFSYALWLIIQAKMSKVYPCQYSSTALMCVMGSIQAVAFAIYMERDWNQWKLGWDIRLLTVAFSGIVASGVGFTLMVWCVHMRGPLFGSIFNPLMLVIVAIAGSLVLNEKLHLGSVLGAVLIVIGLYMVLWGKSKEMKKFAQLTPSKSSRDQSEDININVITSSSLENNSSIHISNSTTIGVAQNSLPREDK